MDLTAGKYPFSILVDLAMYLQVFHRDHSQKNDYRLKSIKKGLGHFLAQPLRLYARQGKPAAGTSPLKPILEKWHSRK
jgi:hypothetical protein